MKSFPDSSTTLWVCGHLRDAVIFDFFAQNHVCWTSAGRQRTSKNIHVCHFLKERNHFYKSATPPFERKMFSLSDGWVAPPIRGNRRYIFAHLCFATDVRQTSEEWSEKKWNFFDKASQNFSKRQFFDARPILGPFNIKDFEYVDPTFANGIFRTLGAILYLRL